MPINHWHDFHSLLQAYRKKINGLVVNFINRKRKTRSDTLYTLHGLTRRQAQSIISQLKNLHVDPQVQTMLDQFKYMLIPFEENTNPRYPQGLSIYLQETKDIEKEADKLDISVSNYIDII